MTETTAGFAQNNGCRGPHRYIMAETIARQKCAKRTKNVIFNLFYHTDIYIVKPDELQAIQDPDKFLVY
jgi:hypothetical protein